MLTERMGRQKHGVRKMGEGQLRSGKSKSDKTRAAAIIAGLVSDRQGGLALIRLSGSVCWHSRQVPAKEEDSKSAGNEKGGGAFFWGVESSEGDVFFAPMRSGGPLDW